ncbi:MAG TPA: hypothetical protein VK152_07260, partial [Paludibacter sp.]|nr:hypothetical protein [Paludibacter sp.]
MYKVMLLVPFFFLTVNPTRSQEYNHHSADSVTWDLYLKGDWDNLVKTGNTILRQDIDFKTLQQRLGYAYFQKGNYLLSRWHYEKALAYDRSDETTNLYLYYTGLNMGDESYTRFYAGKQPEAVKKEYKLHALRLVDEVETEYNYKTGSDMYARSGINFVRLGFNSQIGYRLSLYQTVSNFRQIFNSNTNVNQNGY